MSGAGKVYLIGAGPGDPGLLTLRGKELLERADVVVYDRLVSPAILGFCNPKAKMVDVGKMPTHHKVKQSEINKLLVQFANEMPGATIARLKGGDPFVFGRGGEEALELVAAGIEFEVVPGITSAISVPAYAGIPVSHRGIATSFHIITGHEKADESVRHPEPKAKDPGQNLSLDFETLAKCPGTLIFLMGIANMDFIARRLMECGKDPKTPLAFIEKGTTPYQRTVMATLETAGETIVSEKVTAPAITIMGGVVELGKSLAWKKNLPLSGKRLVVTRAAKQASGITARLTALGAEVIETPMIETRDVIPAKAGISSPDLNALANFDILAFTSTNGVESFFKQLLASGRDIRELAGKKIASVGIRARRPYRRRPREVAGFAPGGLFPHSSPSGQPRRRYPAQAPSAGDPLGGLRDASRGRTSRMEARSRCRRRCGRVRKYERRREFRQDDGRASSNFFLHRPYDRSRCPQSWL